MQHLFLLLFLTCGTLAFAQGTSLRVEPSSVVKDVVLETLESGYQDITPITVTNNTEKTMRVVQRQSIIGKPSSWRYGTFNPRSRGGNFVLALADRESGRPVTLPPGESAVYYVVLEPRGVAGDGRVQVYFSDLNTGRQIGEARVTSEIGRQGAAAPVVRSAPPVRSVQPTEVRIYPNPASERFYIETPPGVRIGRVEGINAVGRRVINHTRPAGAEGYPIDKLPDGIYLISIYDDKGRRLKTLRLSRGRSGA